MLARLFLALLLLAFAVPGAAPAACHEGVTAAHAMPMPALAPDRDLAPIHACIGCIPPSDWLTPPLPRPALVPATPPVAALPLRLAGIAPPPTTPPPRQG